MVTESAASRDCFCAWAPSRRRAFYPLSCRRFCCSRYYDAYVASGSAGLCRLPPMFIVFFISTLAETNRAPFDLPEGESELVAGYFVEYSSMSFALFFLGEYANMILMSAMTTILFLGGWLPPFDIYPLNIIPGPIWFILKICFVLFVFLWMRATTPRYRYDQLMRLGWKVFLPFSLIWVVLTAGFLISFDMLPATAGLN